MNDRLNYIRKYRVVQVVGGKRYPYSHTFTYRQDAEAEARNLEHADRVTGEYNPTYEVERWDNVECRCEKCGDIGIFSPEDLQDAGGWIECEYCGGRMNPVKAL